MRSPGDPRLGRRIAIALLKIYQLVVSPWLGPGCRFEPSCSRYAEHAVAKYGLARGARMAFHRLVRCHPLGGSGYDPIP